VPLLVAQSTFEKWDVVDAIKCVSTEVTDANKKIQSLLTESIYAAAFGAQSPMGRTLYSDAATRASIQSFRERAYVLDGAVLAATGISDHDTFVREVELGFSEAQIPKENHAVIESSNTWLGSEIRIDSPSMGHTYVALAFEAQFSNPLQNIIKKCLSLQGASSFSGPGLIGIHDDAAPGMISDILEKLPNTFMPVSEELIQRARDLAKAEALFALNGGSKSLADSMVSCVLETGTFSAAAVAQAYDDITDAEVKLSFSNLVKNKPALATVGDLDGVPYHPTWTAKFSLGE